MVLTWDHFEGWSDFLAQSCMVKNDRAVYYIQHGPSEESEMENPTLSGADTESFGELVDI